MLRNCSFIDLLQRYSWPSYAALRLEVRSSIPGTVISDRLQFNQDQRGSLVSSFSTYILVDNSRNDSLIIQKTTRTLSNSWFPRRSYNSYSWGVFWILRVTTGSSISTARRLFIWIICSNFVPMNIHGRIPRVDMVLYLIEEQEIEADFRSRRTGFIYSLSEDGRMLVGGDARLNQAFTRINEPEIFSELEARSRI